MGGAESYRQLKGEVGFSEFEVAPSAPCAGIGSLYSAPSLSGGGLHPRARGSINGASTGGATRNRASGEKGAEDVFFWSALWWPVALREVAELVGAVGNAVALMAVVVERTPASVITDAA